MSPDKDADAILSLVLPLCKSVIISAARDVAAANPESLLPVAEKYCADISCELEIGTAFRLALSRCSPDDVLLVFGSLYFASEVRRLV